MEKDIKVALDYYKKGCHLGLSLACKKFNSLSLTVPTPSPSAFKAVEEERIDDALDRYVSYRRPHIKIDNLSATADGTEYYIVEHVDVIQLVGNTVYVRVRHKRYSAHR